MSHELCGRLPLLSPRPAVTLATLKRAATKFRCLANRGTIGVNSLPKTVTQQCHGCNLNPGPSALESSTLTTRLLSHPYHMTFDNNCIRILEAKHSLNIPATHANFLQSGCSFWCPTNSAKPLIKTTDQKS